MTKRLIVLLLVLSVVCSSAFAVGGISDLFSGLFKESSPAEEAISIPVAEKPSTRKPEVTLTALSNVLNGLETKPQITKAEVTELINDLQEVQNDVTAIVKDTKATKLYVETGAQLGFDGGKPTVGAVLGGGVKFGNGLLLGADASYDIAKFGGDKKAEILKGGNALDRFKVNATIGYQF